MTDPIQVSVKKRVFRVHVTLPERTGISPSYQWTDDGGDKWTDFAGNYWASSRLSYSTTYIRVVRVKKRDFRVRTEVKHG